MFTARTYATTHVAWLAVLTLSRLVLSTEVSLLAAVMGYVYYHVKYTFFLSAGEEYAAGRMLTGDVKKILIGILTQMTKDHQDARAAVTDEMVRKFMAVRPIDGSGGGGGAAAGNPVPPPPPGA